MKRIVVLLALFGALGCAAEEKRIVGQTVEARIVEGDIVFSARVDTGAATTSVNALQLTVANGRVEYLIDNGDGHAKRLSSAIVKEVTVRNAEVREKRYVVNLTIDYQGRAKKILVNLNDRARSAYKLLLGRNWLSGSYLVDVDRP